MDGFIPKLKKALILTNILKYKSPVLSAMNFTHTHTKTWQDENYEVIT